jgi:hypothetical protein
MRYTIGGHAHRLLRRTSPRRPFVTLTLPICLLPLVALPVLVGADPASDARAALLSGVTEIVAPGAIPGDLAVTGADAFVVLTARMGRARLPMVAAARYGKGRAVAVGHEGFLGGQSLRNAGNARLAANAARWAAGKASGALRVGLLNGDSAPVRPVLEAAGCAVSTVRPADLPGALGGIDLLWLNQAGLDGANLSRTDAVRQWVQRGGGVVVSGPAWGWQMLNPSLDLTRDQTGNRIVAPMGVAFSNAMLDATSPAGYAVAGDTPDAAHAGRALEALRAHADGRAALTGQGLEQVTTTLGQAVGALGGTRPDFTRKVEALCADRGGNAVPTRAAPIAADQVFARLKAVLDLQKLRRLPAEQVRAHPAAASFPGPVPAEARRETRTVAIDTRRPEWHGLGLYAAPGEVITITLPAAAAGRGLALRIGAHTDTLWHLARWQRFPEVTTSRTLDAPVTKVASAFGGTLFIVVPERCKLGSVNVTVGGAVASPRYVRGETDPAEWRSRIRSAPGPWAEMEGRLVIITVPSASVRDLDDPEALMAYWDEVMERCYELYAAPRRNRPERFCVDRQISAGYMHSGYPIMTGDDVAKAFCDVKLLRGRNAPIWGYYHEMGHNFQRPEWTWEAWGETTNNLFSMYGADRINATPIGAHPAMGPDAIEERVKVVSAAPGASAYYARDPWYPLTMLDLIRQEFGWEPYRKLFTEFGGLPQSARPRTEAQKQDQFLTRLSRILGRDLSGYFSQWGVNNGEAARKQVADLPAWLPASWPVK